MTDKKISQLSNATTPLAGTETLPIVQSGSTVKVSVANLTAGRTVSATTVNCGTLNADNASSVAAVFSRNGGTDANTTFQFKQLTTSWYTGVNAAKDYAIKYNSSDLSTGNALVVTSAGNVSVVNGNLVIGTAGKGIDFSATTHAAGMTSELLDDYEEGTWTPEVYGSTADGTASYSVQKGNYTKVGNLVWAAGRVTFTSHTGTGDMRLRGLPFSATNTNTLEPAVTIFGSDIAMTAGDYMVATQRFNAAYIEVLQTPTGGGAYSAVPMDAAGTLFFTIVYQSA